MKYNYVWKKDIFAKKKLVIEVTKLNIQDKF